MQVFHHYRKHTWGVYVARLRRLWEGEIRNRNPKTNGSIFAIILPAMIIKGEKSPHIRKVLGGVHGFIIECAGYLASL